MEQQRSIFIGTDISDNNSMTETKQASKECEGDRYIYYFIQSYGFHQPYMTKLDCKYHKNKVKSIIFTERLLQHKKIHMVDYFFFTCYFKNCLLE